MIPFWEGEIKQFKEAMKGLLDFDQQDWLTDWFQGDWRPRLGQMSFDKAIEAHEREYKPAGPFPFIPKLMLTLQDMQGFNPTTLDSKRVLTCRGLSRSGYSGQITIWYDKAEYQLALELRKAEFVLPYLSCIYVDRYKEGKKQAVQKMLRHLRDEEPNIDFTLTQVQDLVYPYYVRAEVKPPFEYHRKGVVMVFHVNALPEAGSIGKYRLSKTVHSFVLDARGIGLWFDDPALASYFRLKYTRDLTDTGDDRMIIGTSYD